MHPAQVNMRKPHIRFRALTQLGSGRRRRNHTCGNLFHQLLQIRLHHINRA
jgi:hypothetical protein